MADSVEINPEFEDDDAFDRRINEQRNRTLRSEGPSNVSAPDLADLLFEVNTMSPRAAQTRAFTPQSMNKGGRPRKPKPPPPTAAQAGLTNMRGGVRAGPPPIGGGNLPSDSPLDPISKMTTILNSVQGIVGGAILIANRTTSIARNSVRSAGDISTGLINRDSAGVLGSAAEATRNLDPLGISMPVQVGVAGFEKLLDINQAILDTTRQNLGFAPQSLQAQVRGQLLRLGQQFDQARKFDEQTAQIIRLNTILDLKLGELRADLLTVAIPVLEQMLIILIAANEIAKEAAGAGADIATAFTGNGPMVGAALLAGKWFLSPEVEVKSPPNAPTPSQLQQLNSFFNVGNALGNVPTPNATPPIPNP